MDKLGDLIDAVKPRRDGDVVDRLNYAYTVMVLATFSAITIGWSFVGTPIFCWYPAYFKGYWIEYANEYCFIQNTYFVRLHTRIPDTYAEIEHSRLPISQNNLTMRQERVLPYYQWAPFVLAAQAIFFFLPIVVWRSSNGGSGMCVNTILTESAKNEQSTVDKVAKFLAYHNDITRGYRSSKPIARRFVTFLYIGVKGLFAFNAVMQFFLLNRFLDMGNMWGAQVFSDMLSGRSWEESGAFPRVTMCDFSVRELGNLHRHTVQCVLMINMFYEKFYVAFWFWLFFLATINIISLIHWVTVAATYKSRRFVTEYINWFKSRGQDQAVQSYGPVVDRFIEHLGQDGIILLRLVNTNAGGLVTGALMNRLWDDYMERAPSARDTSTLPVSIYTSPEKIPLENIDEGLSPDRSSSRSSSKQSTV